MILNDFYQKFSFLFLKQPFSNTYYLKIKQLPFDQQYLFFYYCFNVLFYKEYSSYSLYCESKKSLSLKESDIYKGYQVLEKKFEKFLDVYKAIIKSKLSVNAYFKNNSLKGMEYKTFYNTKKLFLQHFAKLHINFENAFDKSKRPKNITHRYDQRHRDVLNKYVTMKLKEKVDNLTNIWIKLSKHPGIAKEYNFKHISYNTLVKIFYQENGIFRLSKKQFRTKHEFRHVVREPGNVQADVKVLGKYETNVGRKVRVFVVRDIATRLTYTKTLKRETSDEVVEALEEARIWFNDQFGINVKSVQTDNAMIFKTTNFVYSTQYFDWCTNNNIKARHIRLNHPESNGIVESFNGMIDKEWHYLLIDCTTWEEVDQVVKKMTHYYNFNRYATFGELRNKKYGIHYKDRYVIPAESVCLIQNLYNKFESHYKR